MNLTPSEQIMYSTLHVTMLDSGNRTIGTATGFLFGFAVTGDKDVTCLVTNRHVLENCAAVRIAFTLQKADGSPDVGNLIKCVVDTKDALFHPDKTVDLAVLTVSPLLNALSVSGREVFFVKFTVENIPGENDWNSYSAIEEVIMAGYPKGFCDASNSLPIFRRGITATHPALNFNGSPKFLVDMPCFEGCSGSPVLICNEGLFVDKRNQAIGVGNKVALLGIQHAIPRQQSVGHLAEIRTGNSASVPVVPLYINLGFIIKSTELFAFENMIRAQLDLCAVGADA